MNPPKTYRKLPVSKYEFEKISPSSMPAPITTNTPARNNANTRYKLLNKSVFVLLFPLIFLRFRNKFIPKKLY